MDLEEYFSRIHYHGPYTRLDLDTLTEILQHHIRAVPFENLSIHCGETIELNIEATYAKIVQKNRGGWCMENNHLLSWVLKTMGYDITLLGANVYMSSEEGYCPTICHLMVRVVINGNSYLVDGGFGASYQMWEPMELVSGKAQPQTPGVFFLTEANGIWYLGKMRRKQYLPDPSFLYSSLVEEDDYKKLYSFTLMPRAIEEFQAVSTYLQTAPGSLFTNKSICTLQLADGLRALIGWTLCEIKYNYKENVDQMEFTTVEDKDIEKTLKEKFNLTLERKFTPVNNKITILKYTL
ncbi:arylamine N-acetyltransferase, pineal gland isozyme NAT-3-like [Rhinatrema bivittatum]|uniref:arylamine N-acetyltransferase, pineal gland isozyme NAT-3-like n=1 Tax=Rhinatrema bivittatum TaxID=194408 RepID=UPI00112EBDF6|nr:arylamine N-acetyltransferase, pineal gland isozyme NAT-3-like [Rhinatrema bivittatum]